MEYERLDILNDARLAHNYLTSMVDARCDYLPYWLTGANENPAWARHCREDDAELVASWFEALASVKTRPDFVPLAVAFKRVANIREKAGEGGGAAVSRALLSGGAETALLDEVERVEGEVAQFRRDRDYAAVLRAVASLKPAVDRFFDEVLVMAEEPAVRANRLGLMKRVSDLFSDVADFRKIQAELPAGAAPDRGA